jgi:NAD(P)-dependent dehydrogenase (short-subunit alcohol dehydrogenase family)
MPSLKAIRAANSSLKTDSLTAVFVGATSGIGLGGIEALLTSIPTPNIYIIGRSESKFTPTLERLRTLNSSATITFLEAQISLLKEVHRVCKTILSQEEKLDILWLSQGALMPPAHKLTEEGLTEPFAVNIYSRFYFMHLLAPLLSKSPDPRVLSILSPGQEGTLNTTDIGLQKPENYGFLAANSQAVTVMSLGMRELSLLHPQISFIHTFPGMVATDVHSRLTSNLSGPTKILGYLLQYAAPLLAYFLGYTPEGAGQVGLFECTDVRFSTASGKGFWRVSDSAEELKPLKVLTGYEEDGTGAKVREHLEGVFGNVAER